MGKKTKENQIQVDVARRRGLPDEMIQIMTECVDTAVDCHCMIALRTAYEAGTSMNTIRQMADVIKHGCRPWTAEALRFAAEGGYSQETLDRLYQTALEEYGDAVLLDLYYPLQKKNKELYIKRLLTARIRRSKIQIANGCGPF